VERPVAEGAGERLEHGCERSVLNEFVYLYICIFYFMGVSVAKSVAKSVAESEGTPETLVEVVYTLGNLKRRFLKQL